MSKQIGLFYHPSGAEISSCGRYRYRLQRDVTIVGKPAAWIMLNPSTADATTDDPTIRRVFGFSLRRGHGRIEVVNLFALRATDPSELSMADDPIGPENDSVIDLVIRSVEEVILAWGTHPMARCRSDTVLDMLGKVGVPTLCLGRSANGSPRHPLYLSRETEFESWDEHWVKHD